MDSFERDLLERGLLRRFHNASDWLKFAEAKNAGLLAFSLALLAAIAGVGSSFDDVPETALLAMEVASSSLVLTAIVVLASYLPILMPTGNAREPKGQLASTDNLEFFGHLAKYDSATLVSTLSRLHGLNAESVKAAFADKLLLDIADQVITNSRIAGTKYRFFALGVYVLVGGFFATGVTGVIYDLAS